MWGRERNRRKEKVEEEEMEVVSQSSKGGRLPNMSSILDEQFSTHTILQSESRLTYHFAFHNLKKIMQYWMLRNWRGSRTRK